MMRAARYDQEFDLLGITPACKVYPFDNWLRLQGTIAKRGCLNSHGQNSLRADYRSDQCIMNKLTSEQYCEGPETYLSCDCGGPANFLSEILS